VSAIAPPRSPLCDASLRVVLGIFCRCRCLLRRARSLARRSFFPCFVFLFVVTSPPSWPTVVASTLARSRTRTPPCDHALVSLSCTHARTRTHACAHETTPALVTPAAPSRFLFLPPSRAARLHTLARSLALARVTKHTHTHARTHTHTRATHRH
jgi:hypothetical protein